MSKPKTDTPKGWEVQVFQNGDWIEWRQFGTRKSAVRERDRLLGMSGIRAQVQAMMVRPSHLPELL